LKQLGLTERLVSANQVAETLLSKDVVKINPTLGLCGLGTS
jgi:hypothetical protein